MHLYYTCINQYHYITSIYKFKKVTIAFGCPAGVGVCRVDSLEVCVKTAKRRFIYLFWGSVTLST